MPLNNAEYDKTFAEMLESIKSASAKNAFSQQNTEAAPLRTRKELVPALKELQGVFEKTFTDIYYPNKLRGKVSMLSTIAFWTKAASSRKRWWSKAIVTVIGAFVINDSLRRYEAIEE